jgi:hypothetical protein
MKIDVYRPVPLNQEDGLAGLILPFSFTHSADSRLQLDRTKGPNP